MKNIISASATLLKKASMLMLLFLAIHKKSFSQMAPVNEPEESMPALFTNVPDTISANIGLLSEVFNQQTGQRMLLQLSDRLTIEGVLTAVSGKPADAIQTFRFIPENFHGTSFVFTRTTGRSGEPLYRGFITGRHIQDCLVLIKENNHYYFIKQNINSLRAE